jgi:deoxyribose-phosphate aldolase
MDYTNSSTPAEIKQTLQIVIANELSAHISSPPSNNAASSALSALASPSTIGTLIDHTLLTPSALPADIIRTTKEAVQWSCASVCVNSSYVSLVRDTLREAGVSDGSAPVPCAVVGFPLGATSTSAKVAEASLAVEDGAKEIDMVIHGASNTSTTHS